MRMKLYYRYAFTLLACLLFSPDAVAQIKVACVGNSITYGSMISNREMNSYPAQLQGLLGEGYEVRNFGYPGRTAISSGDFAYVKTPEYKASLEFMPDIVFVKLGTNDSKMAHMKHIDEFVESYKAIINSYRALPSSPRIILLTPMRSYYPEGESISEVRMQKNIRPLVEQIAYEEGLEIFDTHSLFGKEFRGELVPDEIHPSSIGAGVMARNFYRYLATERDAEYDIFDGLAGGEKFNFYGYQGRDFKHDGLEFKVVQPKVANKKHSWVLRSRFWGHEPQLDLKLLELGFHVVYCNVENLYGAPAAVQRWNKFYSLMQGVGLNSKVVIEAMSRGGLIAYNWAVDNLSKISAIYADAPVLDLKSWPMGEGQYEGSQYDVEQMLEAYSMSKAEMLNYKKNPVNHAAKIAESGVPIVHVIGGVDKIVPPAENTLLFEKYLRAAGGDMTIINKAEVGHHPHSLDMPEPLVNFILKAEGLYESPTTKAARGNEYRSGAGWYDGADWNITADDITTTLAEREVDILMLGNSITQGFAVNRKRVGSCKGNEELKAIFGDYSWESAGMSGDKTQNLLWRVKNGGYDAAKPKYVTIAIGVNNVGDSAEDVYDGIVAVCEAALEEFSEAKIILFGMLPTGATTERWEICMEVLNRLRVTKFGERVKFVDPRPTFADAEGQPLAELYSPDKIHLVARGYTQWAKLIVDTINNL